MCYHLPKPKYLPTDFLLVVHDSLAELTDMSLDVFVITGDSSQLTCSALLADFGLSQIVTESTSDGNILDVFLICWPDLFHCDNLVDGLLFVTYVRIYSI